MWKKLRQLFRWKVSAVVIPVFIALGLAMLGLGGSLAHTEALLFLLAHAFFVLAVAWAVGLWLTSQLLSSRNPLTWGRNRRRSVNLKRAVIKFHALKWIGVAACISILALAAVFVQYVWEKKELSEYRSILFPAHDSISLERCGLESNELGIDFGNMAAKASRFPLTVIEIQDRPAVVINRDQKGNIALSLTLTSRDGKVILKLENNKFFVAPGNNLSMERPDKSTLLLEDPYGNSVRIRYANKQYFSISGKLSFGDRTIDLVRDIPINNICFSLLHGPEGAGVINIK